MISVIKKPQRYTPANNPIIWQVVSDNTALRRFRVDVIETTTNSIISTLEFDPFPDELYGTNFDLSRILSSFVKNEVKPYTNLIDTFSVSILSYRLKITERIISGNMVVDGDVLDNPASAFYVWNASMDSLTFKYYKTRQYVVNANQPVRFLTNKPNFSTVNDFSVESLSFMQENTVPLSVEFKFYDTSNTLLQTYSTTIPNQSTVKQYRINVSPKYLQLIPIDFAAVSHYSVVLKDDAGNEVSEKRSYFYEKLACNLSPVSFFWINTLGGYDSCQFVNPQYAINYDRLLIKKNPLKVNSSGQYSEFDGPVFNSIQDIISVNPKATISVYSQPLTDEEDKWLSEMFLSKKVFMQLENEVVPILISNSSYNINQQKYLSGDLNTKRIDFNISADILPTYKIIPSTGSVGTIDAVHSDFYNK